MIHLVVQIKIDVDGQNQIILVLLTKKKKKEKKEKETKTVPKLLNDRSSNESESHTRLPWSVRFLCECTGFNLRWQSKGK